MPRTKKLEIKSVSEKGKESNLSIPLYDPNGKQKGTVEFPKELYIRDANPKLLAQYVRVYLTNQRQGSASTKTRSDVRGSTRKIYRQKGTGRARHGDIKAPIFVGGGVVGGPKPKDYRLKMNKKQIHKALLYSLSLKLQEKGVLALSTLFKDIEPKTKKFYGFLQSLGLTKEKVLLVLPKLEKKNVVRAARNLPNVEITSDSSLNAYLISKNNRMFLFEDSLKVIRQLANHPERSRGISH